MEKHVHELFSDDILRIASSRFQMDNDSLKKIGGFELCLWLYLKSGGVCITHHS